MKCPKCCKEIANDSNFCEYCGYPIKKSHNKIMWIIFGVQLIVALILLDVFSGELFGKQTRYEEAMCDTTGTDNIEFVDLGLPSGTLWKNVNEDEFYTYDEALNFYGDNLPTEEQWEELINECSWTWTGEGYEVTGNNGNSISLPLAGFHDCESLSGEDLTAEGGYWSSTRDKLDNAYVMSFVSDRVCIKVYKCCSWASVRIVHN